MVQIVVSYVLLFLLLLASRYLKRRFLLLQRLFIPSCLLAGFIALVLGPQAVGVLPEELLQYWSTLPRHLISVVFAGLFLGRIIPHWRQIWVLAGPQIAFGNVLAWGQYIVGGLLAIFILTPIFNVTPLAGALIEISFQGGHGTSAGLAPSFEKLGWTEGYDIAIALATFSLVAAIFSGMFFVNRHSRKHGMQLTEEEFQHQRLLFIKNGYNLVEFGQTIRKRPLAVIKALLGFFLSIGIGALMLYALVNLEAVTLDRFTTIRLFPYMPLFPLAMIGGLIIQTAAAKFLSQGFFRRDLVKNIGNIALDVLIIAAVATMSLGVVARNIEIFLILGLAGVVWIIFCFIFIAPKIFPSHWFIKGLADTGQSMGTTATGLLFLKLVDPSNRTQSRESFSYKQLVIEPFLGGGLITASSIIIIHEFGSVPFLLVSFIFTIFWLMVGVFGFKKGQEEK